MGVTREQRALWAEADRLLAEHGKLMSPDSDEHDGARHCPCELAANYRAAMERFQASRDRKRMPPEPESLWGWPIEEIKSAMRQFQSAHPGKLPSEVEETKEKA